MHDDRRLVEERIERLRERVGERLHRVVAKLDVSAWPTPGEPVGFDEALRGDYSPFPPGTWWGPAWSTWWLRVEGKIPADALGLDLDLRVDLGFVGDWAGNQSEGMVFTEDGWPLKGVNPMNRTVALNHGALAARAADTSRRLIDDDGAVRLYVEAAANPDMSPHMTRPTLQGDTLTRSDEPVWRFGGAEVVVRDDDAWGLWCDLEVLDGLMRQLPEDSTHRARLLRGMERAADAVDAGDLADGAAAARQVLAPLIASGANASAQKMAAVGHAHIDSAWLWPIRETRRKVLRTFSNAVALAGQYPDFHFACTSAQHYQWLKEASPEVFARVREAIDAGQWHAVGGMWVESDTNLPGGESLVRQLTSGLRWMRDELGVRPDCLWLPDSFGYTGALPQLAKLAGMAWFFTQKLSWNQVNSLPHHTFWWEGIDGTKIWTHFPPVDCYDSVVSPEEVKRAESNFKEKGRADHSLLPFGYGDGGGGPVPEMMERIHRFADLEDAPRLTATSPADFFAAASAENADLPTWAGELYLEFHRGVYTTQHELKQGNRRSEHLLAAVELLAALTPGDDEGDRLEGLWRRLLLLQFHDILPGSSTSWVNREAAAEFAAIVAELEAMLAERFAVQAGRRGLLNAASHPRREVISADGALRLVEVPELAVADLASASREPARPVEVQRVGGGFVLDNALVRVEIDAAGTVTSVWDHRARREALLPGARANLLTLHPDHPSCFDAWELQEQYRRQATVLDAVDELQLVLDDPLRARVEVTRTFGDSRVVQSISLDAEADTVDFGLAIDWRQRERVLKVGFPLAVQARQATAEIQFGHIERPVAVNTSWDQARFETPGQRWLLLQEPGYGIALANDSSYGHDVHPAAAGSGERAGGVDVGLTLLRAPNAPDPTADLGEHTFAYSLTVGADVPAAHRAGMRLNQPLRLLDGATGLASAFRLSPATASSFVVIDAVKPAFDGSGDLIVRLHEAAGARSRTELTLGRAAASVTEVDLLEEPVAEQTQALPDGAVGEGGTVGLALRPFQILTLRFGSPL
ncbi:alpha-mannosidase [Tessaracoccus bendigoensis DSM 12906]|uniref:Alpha-mannosidase n=1 Tax=Tessaracoccus bendigoensis DSM 12906 TaxID=1123357 RepID=A0A1M6MGH6_9ACTN|nr:glycoside hydrolase family 38 C-terminal domain-containing protein [Tessaracoccus bendigoensis]SHJ82572.1 alpha-mannosidase [Tessaracoccus bendigoensis DSM 12906]